MMDLSPDEFERFVAAVWDARGFDTTVTSSSNDAGKDVIATRDGRRVAIQAKRYNRSNRVGGPEIQQYASLLHDETIDDVVVVTSSTFTNAAYRRGQEIGVDLVDGERLLTLADRYEADFSGSVDSPDSESKNESSSGISIYSDLPGWLQVVLLPYYLAVKYVKWVLIFMYWYIKVIIKILIWPIKKIL